MLRSLLKHGSAPAPVLLFLSTVVLSVSALRLAHTMSTFANGAPKAAKRPRKVYFGKCEETSQRFLGANPMAPAREKTDDYFWLRDDERKDPDVIGYLNAENKFAEEQTGRLDGLKKRLYDEILSHLKESDEEVPYVYGTYEYYSKTEEKKAYKIHCRRALLSGSSKGAEEVVLDENHLANGYEYSDVSAFRPSPDHSLLAYGVDNNGYETYTLRVKKLQGGALLPDVIEEVSGLLSVSVCLSVYVPSVAHSHPNPYPDIGRRGVGRRRVDAVLPEDGRRAQALPALHARAEHSAGRRRLVL